MTEVIMLILSCFLALFLFIWLAFGRKVTSKAATLLMDICLIALCIAALICGLTLRREKYESIQKQNLQEENIPIENISKESIPKEMRRLKTSTYHQGAAGRQDKGAIRT